MKKSFIVILCLIMIGSLTAYAETVSPDEPEMWEIVGNPELEETYKKSHPFLDDMCYWSIEHPGRVQEFGYSPIWDVLEVRLVTENGGEEVLLYYDVPENYVDGFKETNDPDRFYIYFIENDLQRMEIMQLPNQAKNLE